MVFIIIHEAGRDETIYSISSDYGVNCAKTASDNALMLNAKLTEGQALIIDNPDDGKGYGEKIGKIEVKGFAFANIGRKELKNTLPFLTYLSIFCHKVLPEGELDPVDDSEVIAACKEEKVRPVMVVANINDLGYDSRLAEAILNSDALQKKLINGIFRVMKEKGYDGLLIDFEYIYPKDKEAYNAFLERIRVRWELNGWFLMTGVAAKTSSSQKGIRYEAYDFKAHEKYADRVISMAYGLENEYGRPMPVSPVPTVRRVLKCIAREIDAKKIIVGIPNYGYDWVMPQQHIAAKFMNNDEAASAAVKHGAKIQYDRRFEVPFFEYADIRGRRHKVWFEDARSIRAKLLLISEYNLGGCGIWTVNAFFPPIFLILRALFDICKFN